MSNTAKNNATTCLNHIDLYNQKVATYLDQHPLTPLQQEAIKIFKNQAQQNKLTDAAYNKAVEQFNQHGYILRKRGLSYVNKEIDNHYNYINLPYIDSEAYRETMRNYRQYVHEYNLQAKEYNKTVASYNNQYTGTKNDILLAEIKAFKVKNNPLFSRNYNKKAVEFNTKKGKVYIKKKKVQTVKYGAELFFSVILGFYTKQLRQFTDKQLKCNKPTSIKKNGLKSLEIDHRKLATHKIDDIPRLDICKRTAQNHVKRLREAGLLTHYVYSNQFHAIKVCINYKILVIFDGNLPKSQNIENKQITVDSGKELHNNSDTTRTLLKEKEKKSDVFNIGSLISDSMLQSLKTSPAVSYKNTRKKVTENPGPEVSPKISENARKIIKDDMQLAEDLHRKIYDNYTVLRYDRLQKLVFDPNFNRVEFKKLVIQDIIKQAAKIWRNHPVYVGEWKRTINLLNENMFKNIHHKENILLKLKEYRWKIDFARKWFLKNSVNALYPFEYFDPTRKTTNEIGFYGLHYAWKSHLNYCEKRKKQHQQLKIDANARKRKISDDKKMQNILKKYYTGKVKFEQMYDYINHNLPKMYMDKLEELFKNYNHLIA